MRFLPAIASIAIGLWLAICPTGRAEWTLALYGGKAQTEDTDIEIAQPAFANDLTFHDIALDDDSFKMPIYYGVRVGRFLASEPRFGIEIEFLHPKVYADDDEIVRVSGTRSSRPIDEEIRLGDIVQRFSISHGFNMLLANVVARTGFWPDEAHPVGRVQIVGRFGLGPSILHPETTIGGVRDEHYELDGMAWQVAAECRAALTRHLFAFVEYKRTYLDAEFEVVQGEGSSTLETNHFIAGLGVSF